MKSRKVVVFLLLLLCVNLNEASSKKSVAIHNIKSATDPIDLINDLANSDLADTLAKLAIYLDPEAGPVVGIIIGFIKVFTDRSAISPETQMILDAIDRQTRMFMDALSNIADMISSIADQLVILFDKMLFEQKYQGIRDNMDRISSAYDQFGLILVSYTDQDELVEQLKKFVQDTRDKNYDFEIVKPVTNDEDHGGSESVITSYLNFIMNNDIDLKCTPNQQIGWFYNHILRHADKINVLLLTAYELLETIEKADYTSDKNYMINKMTLNTESIRKAVASTYNRYNSEKGFVFSVQHRIATPQEDVNFVQLNRVFYEYILWERDLAIAAGYGDTCGSKCYDSDYDAAIIYDEPRCNGRLWECHTIDDTTVHEVMDAKRLYSGYYDSHTWAGASDGPGESRTIKSWNRGAVVCSVCRCVCSNYLSKDAKKWFYTGALTAPDQYVITGMRFIQKERVLFIQPQVSQLLDIGRVDANTTYWLDLPELIPIRVKFEDTFEDTVILTYKTELFMRTAEYYLDKNHYVTELKLKKNESIIEVFPSGKEVLVDADGKVTLGNLKEAISWDGVFDIKFNMSSREHDAAQHVEPMFDAQDIVLDDPLPLTGIVTYNYKTAGLTQNNFISPQLIGADTQKRDL